MTKLIKICQFSNIFMFHITYYNNNKIKSKLMNNKLILYSNLYKKIIFVKHVGTRKEKPLLGVSGIKIKSNTEMC